MDLDEKHTIDASDNFSKIAGILKLATQDFELALHKACAGNRRKLEHRFYTLLESASCPIQYWHVFDRLISSKAHSEEERNVISAYKLAFAAALFEFITPFQFQFQHIFAINASMKTKLEALLNTPVQHLISHKKLCGLVMLNEIFDSAAHQLPFNLPILFDLMTVLEKLETEETTQLVCETEACVDMQIALLYIEQYCTAQLFLELWHRRRDSLSSDYQPEEMAPLLLTDHAATLKFSHWCLMVQKEAAVRRSGIVGKLLKLFVNTNFFGLFAELEQTASQIERLSQAIPQHSFNTIIPVYPGETKKFIFVKEPSICLICLDPVTTGVSPCPNSECGLSAHFVGQQQHCHYRCFRSFAWSFQYDEDGVFREARSIRCMLCKTLYALETANLAICQLMPTKKSESLSPTQILGFDGKTIEFSAPGKRKNDTNRSVIKRVKG
jgi:hypothetical protein